MHVRNACDADLAAILAIFNDVIATSTAVYRDEPTSLEERRQWFEARAQARLSSFCRGEEWPSYRVLLVRRVSRRVFRLSPLG